MEEIIDKINEFHEAFGIAVSEKFGYVDPKRDALHYDLLIEEVEEFREACLNQNAEKIIDGIGDVLFVAISAAMERGMGDMLKEVVMEISRANISKKGNSKEENVYRGDGKVLRSPNYTPPNIKKIIEQHKIKLVCKGCPEASCIVKNVGLSTADDCPLGRIE